MSFMHQRPLGRTDLRVSAGCLDLTALDRIPSAEEAMFLLDAFRAAGGNFLQLPAGPGDPVSDPGADATAAALVGRWMHTRRIPRPEVVLACSIRFSATCVTSFRLATTIRARCEAALRDLGTSYLDLLYLSWEHELPVDDTLVAVEYLRRGGMFRHLGGVAYPAWRAMEWIAHADKRGLTRLDALQPALPPTLATGAWMELRDLARHRRLGLVVRPAAGADRLGLTLVDPAVSAVLIPPTSDAFEELHRAGQLETHHSSADLHLAGGPAGLP